MPNTREIPRERWDTYLGTIARTEQHRPVRVEVEAPEGGSQQVAERLPLLGLSLEARGGSDIDITVEAGTKPGDFEHRVPHAERLYALEDDEGRIECLDIETGGQTRTLVYFD